MTVKERQLKVLRAEPRVWVILVPHREYLEGTRFLPGFHHEILWAAYSASTLRLALKIKKRMLLLPGLAEEPRL